MKNVCNGRVAGMERARGKLGKRLWFAVVTKFRFTTANGPNVKWMSNSKSLRSELQSRASVTLSATVDKQLLFADFIGYGIKCRRLLNGWHGKLT